MYPEYEKIKAFTQRTEILLNTSKKMEDIFNYSTKSNAKKSAVCYLNGKGKLKHYNYSLFKKHTYEIASILSNFMIQQPKNRPIVLKIANGPHWGEIFWAILMCGYKPLLIDAKTNKEGTENLINQAKAAAIITDDTFSYNVPKFSLTDILEEKASSTYGFSATWENEVIFCSSGTTGDVKLMVFDGENLVNQIYASVDVGNTTKDIIYPKNCGGDIHILAMVPFHHIFGFIAVFLWYFFYGCELVFTKSMAPSDIQSICQRRRVTHIYSVPLFWDSVAQQIERKKAMETPIRQQYLEQLIGYNTGKLSAEMAGPYKATQNAVQNNLFGRNVRFCISGGGYLSGKTQTLINGIGYPLYNGYGMTEIGITSVELSPIVELRLKGSIGIPFHGVQYKIVPSSPNSQSGELFVKSQFIHFREIIGGVEKKTQLDSEGYFATGDIAEKDATNRYYLKGRIKDVIINSDGENIFPDELEIFFKKVPHILQLCVLGINTKGTTNQKIVCALEVDNNITDEELDALKAEIKRIGMEDLTKGTKITDFYFAKKKLPVANNMKVKRFLVKKAIESKSPDYVSIDYKHETKKFKDFDEKTVKEIAEPMRNIFSKILILPKFKIDDDGHWINDLGGDSMSYVELITKVQDEFDIIIPENLYGQLTTLNEFVEEVAKLKKKK